MILARLIKHLTFYLLSPLISAVKIKRIDKYLIRNIDGEHIFQQKNVIRSGTELKIRIITRQRKRRGEGGEGTHFIHCPLYLRII